MKKSVDLVKIPIIINHARRKKEPGKGDTTMSKRKIIKTIKEYLESHKELAQPGIAAKQLYKAQAATNIPAPTIMLYLNKIL